MKLNVRVKEARREERSIMGFFSSSSVLELNLIRSEGL